MSRENVGHPGWLDGWVSTADAVKCGHALCLDACADACAGAVKLGTYVHRGAAENALYCMHMPTLRSKRHLVLQLHASGALFCDCGPTDCTSVTYLVGV